MINYTVALILEIASKLSEESVSMITVNPRNEFHASGSDAKLHDHFDVRDNVIQQVQTISILCRCGLSVSCLHQRFVFLQNEGSQRGTVNG